MKDHSWVTTEMFDSRLREIVNDELNTAISPFDNLISIPGVYEILAEHYNNDVLNELEDDRQESAR
jgi:hypothetical protein